MIFAIHSFLSIHYMLLLSYESEFIAEVKIKSIIGWIINHLKCDQLEKLTHTRKYTVHSLPHFSRFFSLCLYLSICLVNMRLSLSPLFLGDWWYKWLIILTRKSLTDCWYALKYTMQMLLCSKHDNKNKIYGRKTRIKSSMPSIFSRTHSPHVFTMCTFCKIVHLTDGEMRVCVSDTWIKSMNHNTYAK